MADPNRQPRRVAPELELSTVGLRPAATGAFNYAPPPQEKGFADALKALSQVEPQIEAIASQISEKNRKRDEAEGQQRALEAGGMSEEEAIKAGKLSVTDSSAFRIGYRTQYWRTQAVGWANEGREAWVKSGAPNSDDPQAAQKFLQQFFADKLKDVKDPHAREAALPVIQQSVANIIQAQSEFRQKRQMSDHLHNFGIEATSVINDVMSGRLSNQAAAAKFQDIELRAKGSGVDIDKLHEEFVLAVTNKARALTSTAPLELLKLNPKIAGVPKYESAIRSAADAIQSKAMSMESLRMSRLAHAERLAEKKALADAFTLAVKLGGRDLPPDYLEKLAQANPQAVPSVLALSKNIRDNSRQDDPHTEFQATMQIWMSTNPMQELQRIVPTMKGEALQRLTAFALRQHNEPSAAGRAEVNKAIDSLDGMFREGGPMAAIADRISPKQFGAAKMLIFEAVNQFMVKNPHARGYEIQTYANQLALEQAKALEQSASAMGTDNKNVTVDEAVRRTNNPGQPVQAPAAPPRSAPVPAPPQKPGAKPAPAAPAPATQAPAQAKPSDLTKLTSDELLAFARRPDLTRADIAAINAEVARREKLAPKR